MGEDLLQGSVVSGESHKVLFEGGKLIAQVNFERADGLVSLSALIKLDANKVVDAIEAAIPGQLDNAVLEVLRATLLQK